MLVDKGLVATPVFCGQVADPVAHFRALFVSLLVDPFDSSFELGPKPGIEWIGGTGVGSGCIRWTRPPSGLGGCPPVDTVHAGLNFALGRSATQPGAFLAGQKTIA